jgi:hypothetical protein
MKGCNAAGNAVFLDFMERKTRVFLRKKMSNGKNFFTKTLVFCPNRPYSVVACWGTGSVFNGKRKEGIP